MTENTDSNKLKCNETTETNFVTKKKSLKFRENKEEVYTCNSNDVIYFKISKINNNYSFYYY